MPELPLPARPCWADGRGPGHAALLLPGGHGLGQPLACTPRAGSRLPCLHAMLGKAGSHHLPAGC